VVYTVAVTVTLRPSILDPQGRAVRHALHSLGYEGVEEVRVGKHVALRIEADAPEEAEAVARAACEKLLANPVMEDYAVEVLEPSAAA